MRTAATLLLVALLGAAGSAAGAHAEALREISPPVADAHPEQVAAVVEQVLAAAGCEAYAGSGAAARCSDERAEADAAKSDDPCAYQGAEANAMSDWTGAGARLGCGKAAAHSRTGPPDAVRFGEDTQRQVNSTLRDGANKTGIVVRPPDGVAAGDALAETGALAQTSSSSALPVGTPDVPPPTDAAGVWRWVRWFTG